MYYKLEDNELKRIKEIESMAFSDYELIGNLIPVDSLIDAINDIFYEYEELKEKHKDLEQNLEENYKPIPIDLGLSDRDFY